MKETFIGDPITPEDLSFSVSSMSMGKPGLPRTFSWKGRRFSVLEVLEEWKESGNCRHGSGERYIRKHWFRVRATENLEMRIYFERQDRSSGGSRWRLYSIRNTESGTVTCDDGPAKSPSNSGAPKGPSPLD
jgi:phosphoribosylglycinamide formyltransferase-1